MQSEWLNFCDLMGVPDSQGISSPVVHSSSIANDWRKCDDEAEMKRAKNVTVNSAPGDDLLRFADGRKFGTILCDPHGNSKIERAKLPPSISAFQDIDRLASLALRSPTVASDKTFA